MKNRSSQGRTFSPGLVVSDLWVTYANGVTAVRGASFALRAGTITALVGVNGSGKSSLFKAIMGFLTPARGEVTLSGKPVREALKSGLVAYVPQAEEVDWTFPVLVEDVVMMGRYGRMNLMRIPRAADRAAVSAALERVGLAELRKRQIGEPFTGVDVKTENAIIMLLRAMRDEGRLMLVSTHNLGSVPDFCDEVVLFNQTVLAQGPTATTFTEANLAEAFGGSLRHIRLGGGALHDDDDDRRVTVLTDDERPLVLYGPRDAETLVKRPPEEPR